MRRIGILAAVAVLTAVSTATMAFEEQKMKSEPPASAGAAKAAPSAAGGLGITPPELSTKVDAGTKIRVPGLGVIGEIPKMDFGLELLYGASQSKALDNERTQEPNGVMVRGRLPLKSP